jgi:hypothetical protein
VRRANVAKSAEGSAVHKFREGHRVLGSASPRSHGQEMIEMSESLGSTAQYPVAHSSVHVLVAR